MTELSEFERQQRFIEGKGRRPQPCAEGFAASVASGFKNIVRILSQGGAVGHLRYHDDGNGWYSVSVVAGPFEGCTGLYQAGAINCLLDWKDGKSVEIAVH